MQKDHNKSNLEKFQHKARLKTQTIVENTKVRDRNRQLSFSLQFQGEAEIFLTTAFNSTFTQPSEDDV